MLVPGQHEADAGAVEQRQEVVDHLLVVLVRRPGAVERVVGERDPPPGGVDVEGVPQPRAVVGHLEVPVVLGVRLVLRGVDADQLEVPAVAEAVEEPGAHRSPVLAVAEALRERAAGYPVLGSMMWW